MNFQQLRILRETVRHQFNLTGAANALCTSQSGVSKHIKDLEDELGVTLFVRKGKRLVDLTEPGRELVVIAERILLDAHNAKNLASHYADRDEGELVIAATHTQSRYALPRVVREFKKKYPNVRLKLHQGSPHEIAQMLQDGEADIGVATEALAHVSELLSFKFYAWRHALVVPHDHPLVGMPSLSFEAIAEYPIMTYHEGFTGRSVIDERFRAARCKPNVILSALDSDVIKTYVELGLGVGIIASVAFDADKDSGLTLLDASHLFPQNMTRIAVRQGHFLRRFAYHFMQLCNPDLNEEMIKSIKTQTVFSE